MHESNEIATCVTNDDILEKVRVGHFFGFLFELFMKLSIIG